MKKLLVLLLAVAGGNAHANQYVVDEFVCRIIGTELTVSNPNQVPFRGSAKAEITVTSVKGSNEIVRVESNDPDQILEGIKKVQFSGFPERNPLRWKFIFKEKSSAELAKIFQIPAESAKAKALELERFSKKTRPYGYDTVFDRHQFHFPASEQDGLSIHIQRDCHRLGSIREDLFTDVIDFSMTY